MTIRASHLSTAALLALGACLPSETRPEPGELVYTLSGAADVLGGVQSSDGWSIEFSRFLLAASFVSTHESSACAVAALADTPTLVDVRVPGNHEVGRVLATGECGFTYHVGPLPPREHYDVEEWLGPGVTEEDLALVESLTTGAYVEGEATKGAVTKVFRWPFFIHDFCSGGSLWGAGDGAGPTIRVRSGATERVDLAIRGDHLFFDRMDEAAAQVRFDPIAGADTDPAYGNADGEVTREELMNVPLSAVARADGAYSSEWPLDLATWMDMRMANVGHLNGTEACSSLDLE
ncbi:MULTISPECIES: hypothetical protein [Sorangium]|uniref:Uncharacterized protein n=1 Tax=Sorangium cellulosum TaxID=56 RepID=A0A4P2QI43_SORCE|nr:MULTISPECIES: hypothetical protein [Sorangium]AUX29013.1 uncharacterized protein SOCE836_010980 [Sorangium cellulosum]WCQ88402.1 hypothetical protein NQZ70_01078 [Sorangium sp. Soce836]